MTIFDIISNIITTKNKADISVEEEREYQFFLINRWLSMHSGEFASLVNETTNKYWSCLSKDELNKLLINTVPRQRYKKIDYIKKIKKEKTKEDETIEMLAKNLEVSQREIKMYSELVES
jgi:DNA primase catalytic subunit